MDRDTNVTIVVHIVALTTADPITVVLSRIRIGTLIAATSASSPTRHQGENMLKIARGVFALIALLTIAGALSPASAQSHHHRHHHRHHHGR